MFVLASVLYMIFQQRDQIFFSNNRFIFTFTNGSGVYCRIALDAVGKSTVAENFGGKMEKVTGVKSLSEHPLER